MMAEDNTGGSAGQPRQPTLLDMVKNAMSGERGSRPNDAISGRWLLATVYQGGVTPEAVADTDWLHAALGVGKDTIASDVESLRKKRGLKDLAGKTIDGVRVFRPSGEESLGGRGEG